MGILGDITGGLGKLIGTVVGTVVGVPLAIVAKTLGITVDMVEKAKDAGCETYEEIKDFFDL